VQSSGPATFTSLLADIKNSEILSDGFTKVVRISGNRVVKYGMAIDFREVEAMKFVASNTIINIPKVHEVLQGPDQDYPSREVMYFIMDYIPGNTLRNLWDSLNKEERTDILGQLRAIMDHLRALQPPGYWGGVNGQSTGDDILWGIPQMGRMILR
jgi:serine/threonine protein kinase